MVSSVAPRVVLLDRPSRRAPVAATVATVAMTDVAVVTASWLPVARPVRRPVARDPVAPPSVRRPIAPPSARPPVPLVVTLGESPVPAPRAARRAAPAAPAAAAVANVTALHCPIRGGRSGASVAGLAPAAAGVLKPPCPPRPFLFLLLIAASATAVRP
ncbi:unnamed protein product [Closterium sp. Naga37s-1]|nr:unnamed protein product [Closterium sp. Naga37s-1]